MNQHSQFQAGLHTLRHPILPLIRLVQLLYLTGPFTTVAEILPELHEPIETNAATYEDPPQFLQPYLGVLQLFEALKYPGLAPADYRIVDDQLAPLDPFEALELWVNHQALSQELADLNSQLCAPCHCHLCCTGPEPTHRQQFFEIPLHPQELGHFPLPVVDTPESRSTTALAEPPLSSAGRPFYQTAAPALYHWQPGWSLILPQATACPNLESHQRGCRIYPNRPEVCLKPQIFPYLLERRADLDHQGATPLPTYLAPRKLLAIWDCPYVKQFKDEIATYAELCELEPIFKENKG